MRKVAILLLSVALLFTSFPVYSQTVKERKPDEAIKLSTELVALDVQIVDRKTQRVVSGLSQDDFEIYEDGVKQQIGQFSQDKLPLSVVLLLDASSSMWTVLERLRANAVEALQSLKPEDEVAVVVTANETLLVRDFTKEKFLVAEALRELDFKAYGDNAILLHDSVYRAASHLVKAANPADRRVIIVVTDNETIPAHNWRVFQKEQAVSLVLETGVVVCGLVIKHNLPTRAASKILGFPSRLGGGDVHNYAETTGGEVLAAGNDTVGQKLIELIEHLRTRYSLAFVPSNTKRDGKFRRLKIRLAAEREQQLRNAGSKDLVIRTRSGYYAGKK
ncbi:MAG: VWA domain-containing protein [Acidobacteriota bacterium]